MKEVKLFNESTEKLIEHNKKMILLNARRTVADAEKDQDKIAALGAEIKAHSEGWFDLYRANKNAALELCKALDVDPKRLEDALR